MAGMESCRRAAKTLLFMAAMVGSLLVPSAPVLVAAMDVGFPSLILATLLSSSVQAERKLSYSFRASLLDILIISVARSLVIICAYSLAGIRCGAYLIIALLLGVSSAAAVAFKACIYAPAGAESFTSSSSWGVALLFVSSFVCALGHGVSAYRTSCQAKRKQSFLPGDDQPSFFCKYTIKLKFRSTAFFPKLDKDEQLPVCCNLADINSQFMLCRGLHLHYKLVQGNNNSNNHINRSLESFGDRSTSKHHPLTRTGSSSFPGSRLPREDLRTPLLSSAYSLPSKTELDFGWSTGDDHVISFEEDQPNSGPESRKGVVLVHGFGGGVFSWRLVIEPLARQSGYTSASFDRPGWGLTSGPSKKECGGDDPHLGLPNPYDLQSQVDLLLDFCKQLGFSSVVLVGHDDGGLLALMAAAKSSNSPASSQVAVRGVVLIGVSSSREMIPAFARVLLHTSLGRRMLEPLLCSDITNRHAWHDASKLTSQVMDLYKVPLQWDQAEARRSLSVVPCQVTPELLRMVQNVPALLVAGTQDMLVPLQAVESLASQLSRSKLVAIPRCGHLPPEECPGPLLAALVPFIVETLRGEIPTVEL